jgi:Zn-finger nucleic acid-binding protein
MATEHFLVDDFGLDRCLTCGAIWFDAKELQRVEGCEHRAAILGSSPDTDRAPRITIAKTKRMRCPRDGATLTLQQHWDQPHVDLDACPTCYGVLLECGELTDLATHTWRERVRAWWRGS